MKQNNLEKEIEKIIWKRFSMEQPFGEKLHILAGDDPEKAVPELLSLISKTIDSVIGEDEEQGDTLMTGAGNMSIWKRNELRKQQRQRKKFILSDNEGELFK